ncbi:MAG: sodium-dependent transporter [Bacteroidales bacterium]|nr:sodium-dependent transporter [Candidatus Colimorpha onthohippi]
MQKSFSSNVGAIMAAVGSAVGLGNIWRFPYICGKYGGGAFLLVYIVFVFVLGMILLISEFVIGRRSQHTPILAYPTLAPHKPKWKYLGMFGLVTCFFILSQYFVISGWTLRYFVDSVAGTLFSLGQDTEAITAHFTGFTNAVGSPILYLVIFAVLTVLVILGGVQKGIEAVSKLLMPVLLILVLALCVRSITLPGASKGIAYLFNPNFALLTGEGILAALGQALFSLSVGMGVMVVYGSYIPKNDNIFKTSLWITACDTLIAVLAGVAIIPAVFSCGMEPAGGPGLVFKVLPSVFNSMGGMSSIFAALFFALLIVAALTSAISLLECLIASVADVTGRTRVKSIFVVMPLLLLLAAVVSLGGGVWSSFKVFGYNLFDLVDCLNSIYLPPICALGSVVFVGWVMPEDSLKDELSNGGSITLAFYSIFKFIVRYIAPLALVVVLVAGILK